MPKITPEQVRELRARRGLTQEDMARSLGVTARTYWRWENTGPSHVGSLLLERELDSELGPSISHMMDDGTVIQTADLTRRPLLLEQYGPDYSIGDFVEYRDGMGEIRYGQVSGKFVPTGAYCIDDTDGYSISVHVADITRRSTPEEAVAYAAMRKKP